MNFDLKKGRDSEFEFSGPSSMESTSAGTVGSGFGFESESTRTSEATQPAVAVNVEHKLTETTITMNGMPGNVSLAQITKMFA